VTRTPILIAGAGPTGLSAAYHLGEDALLVERNSTVGGWCRSVVERGYTFDYAGHIMFSNDADVRRLYELLLGDNVHWQDREAWIYTDGVYTRYPFQGALYGLPPSVIKECLVGAIAARFGDGHSIDAHARANGTTGVHDCCADGTIDVAPGRSQRSVANGHAEARSENFDEFVDRTWGAGIAKYFARPYNRKLWTVPLAEMETSWLGGRVPMPDLAEMIDGALQPVSKPMGPNARFGYPLHGGFQALMNGFLPHLARPPQLDCDIIAVDPAHHRVATADGGRIDYDAMISTMPLPHLVRALGDCAPPDIRAAADGLRSISVRCVHLGIGREAITDKHWIYYAGDPVFHRIFVQGNASPHCNPPGGFGLTCEISYSPTKPLPVDGNALIERCIADCRRVGIIREDDRIDLAMQVDLPYAYVLYDHQRAPRVAKIRAWLREHDIHLAGRYSEWEYYNSDHAFIAGRRAADAVRAVAEQAVNAG
jgi:protoporphyrinogen oxidase